jgi:hypothetical protein
MVGCHSSQFCLVVVIAMPVLYYRFLILLKWIWFEDLNLNIYMMHKIILQFLKNRNSHGLLNSKLMDFTFDFHLYLDYATIH